jgi:pseudaminic acid synthase
MIQIGKFSVGPEHRPFIVAEMSGNHNQSLDRALALVDAAAAAGAHALKLQTYTADTITLDARGGLFEIADPNSLWAGRNLHDLYKEAYTPWEWHKPIFDRARALGMEAFSSPFDETAVDFLETLDVPAYKIASFENSHHPLIRKAARTGKPIIVSTGASQIADLDETVRLLRSEGANFILLKCTSTYPATPQNTHLRTIPHMAQLFGCPVGLSDHTMGVGASVAAVALGAVLIEKHFTLRRADGGVDSAFSLEPEELASLVTETERAWLALGQVQYGVQKAETKSVAYKRSLYVAEDIAAGEAFTATNIRIIRPGDGLAPKYYEQIIGRHAVKALKRGTPLNWDAILG